MNFNLLKDNANTTLNKLSLLLDLWDLIDVLRQVSDSDIWIFVFSNLIQLELLWLSSTLTITHVVSTLSGTS